MFETIRNYFRKLLNRNFLAQQGFTIVEILVSVGLMGILMLGVVSINKIGFMGQKTVRDMDDSRIFTGDMSTLLSDSTACLNTLGPAATNNPSTGFSISAVKDKAGSTKYSTGTTYNTSVKLMGITVGGAGNDTRSGIAKCSSCSASSTSANILVSVRWQQTDRSGNTTGDLYRTFFVNATLDASTRILTCTAVAGATTVASSGSGAAGNLALWSTPSTLATSNVYQSGSYVGIGTATPMQMLHIDNAAGEEGYPGIFIQDPSSNVNYGGSLYFDDRGGLNHFKMSVTNNGTETGFISLNRATGNVGIGSTDALEKLDVTGYAKANAFSMTGQTTAAFTGSSSSYMYASLAGGASFPFTSTGNLVLQSRSDLDRAIVFITGTTPANRMTVGGATGNVGINTDSPSLANLQVNGTIMAGSGNTTITMKPNVDVTALNPGGSTNASIIDGPSNFHLFLDLRNNSATDTIAMRYSAANNMTVDTIGFVLKASGLVGINSITPAARLDVADTNTASSAIIVPRAAGAFTGTNVNGMIRYNSTSNLFEFRQNGAWVSYTVVSDGRLKTQISPVNKGLEIVNHLNPIFFHWDKNNSRTQSFSSRQEVGFIAQEVEKVLPEVVNQGEDSYRTMDYGKMVAVAVAAIKELYSKVLEQAEQILALGRDLARKVDQTAFARLQAEFAQLKTENTALKARLDRLEQRLPAR